MTFKFTTPDLDDYDPDNLTTIGYPENTGVLQEIESKFRTHVAQQSFDFFHASLRWWILAIISEYF